MPDEKKGSEKLDLWFEILPADEECSETWAVYPSDIDVDAEQYDRSQHHVMLVFIDEFNTRLLVRGMFLEDDTLFQRALQMIELHRRRWWCSALPSFLDMPTGETQ